MSPRYERITMSINKHVIYSPSAPEPVGPYSQAIYVHPWIFASGQIPLDPATGLLKNASFEEEVHQVLQNISAVLDAAGSSLNHLVKVSVFLTDMTLFGAFNDIYATYVDAPFPARSTIEVSQLPKQARIEIEVIALKAD